MVRGMLFPFLVVCEALDVVVWVVLREKGFIVKMN